MVKVSAYVSGYCKNEDIASNNIAFIQGGGFLN